MKKSYLLFLIILILSVKQVSAQMTARVVADSLFMPWELVYAPDNHIWFTQKNGYVCRLEPVSGVVDTLFYESSVAVQSESGMLGMVLHPDFPNTPHVFIAYNYQLGGMKVRVARYTYSNNQLSSPTIIIQDIKGSGIHNGCRLAIVDGKLYITTGDAADTGLPQDVTSVNGKVLRLNLDGTIPSDNPLPGSPVWTWGHRNAQGLVWANNRFYSSEHGPSSDDELNILEKGRNFGWPNVQGYCNTTPEQTFCTDSNVVEPIMAWTPTLAVGDIDYYDHPMFPALQGSVLMVTLKDMKMYQLKLNSTFDAVASTNVIPEISGSRMRAICIDPDGRIYVSTSMSMASGTGPKIDKIIELYDPTYSSVANLLKERNQQVAVYPNPAREVLNVYTRMTNGADKYAYAIVNSTGQVIATGNLRAGNNMIALSGIAAGVYWLRVTDGKAEISGTKFNKL